MSFGYHNIQPSTQDGLAISQSSVAYQSDVLARFWAKVDRKGPADCWLWTASVTGRGRVNHGQFTYREGGPQVHVYAHRFSWMLARGPIPKGLQVCHRCDVPRCVNPAHLFLGTQGDNVNDASRKGRYNIPHQTKAFDLATRQRIFHLPYERGLITRLAKEYGVTKACISVIRRGRFTGLIGTPKPVGVSIYTRKAFMAPVLERVPSVPLPVRGDVA